MGTETRLAGLIVRLILRTIVKLNNPLMGTETLVVSVCLVCVVCLVKLNNPLMGTETIATALSSARAL